MNGRVLLIGLGYSLSALRQRMEQFLLTLLIAFSISLGIAAFAGQMIARRALRPLEQMATRAKGISASNLHDRLTIPNPRDELGHLASAFMYYSSGWKRRFGNFSDLPVAPRMNSGHRSPRSEPSEK